MKLAGRAASDRFEKTEFKISTRKGTIFAMKLLLVCALMACVNADTYVSNPRGSNNRLNEDTVNRRNGDRMFDSQVGVHISRELF